MKLCIIDFETTSTDVQEAVAIEYAACIVNEDWSIEKEAQALFKYSIDIEIPQAISKLTGIRSHTLEVHGIPPEEACRDLLETSQECTHFVAHFAEYDFQILMNSLKDSPLRKEFSSHPAFDFKNWICTVKDVPYPDSFTCRKLAHLAVDHGVWPEKGEKVHRALADVHLVRNLMLAGPYGAQQIIDFKNEPFVYLKALVRPPWEDDGKSTGEAKKEGFRFEQWPGDEKKFPKQWIKRIKESQLCTEEKKNLPFKRQIIDTLQY